ncbi:hypothetical protein GCM10011575_32990 [Microlunatus endophyticus]|uniref:YCII-related domain-containing protein n=1 Tax=Microlunatus endophyticus TaxID=1716077 RepID=A0A917SCI1_9ACTN|nr:YciI family protein [Microlunatus endophyticus]GGL72022.1 hypothetical protein GCM10011575_32990 [Microlunatus endophyticus]
MKYLILIHSNPSVIELFAAMTDVQRREAFQTYFEIESELEKSGELLESKALEEKVQHYVQRGAEGPIVTDAPLAEVTEIVTGFYLVDVRDEARAFEIAARFPEAVTERGVRVVRVWTQDDFEQAMS